MAVAVPDVIQKPPYFTRRQEQIAADPELQRLAKDQVVGNRHLSACNQSQRGCSRVLDWGLLSLLYTIVNLLIYQVCITRHMTYY